MPSISLMTPGEGRVDLLRSIVLGIRDSSLASGRSKRFQVLLCSYCMFRSLMSSSSVGCQLFAMIHFISSTMGSHLTRARSYVTLVSFMGIVGLRQYKHCNKLTLLFSVVYTGRWKTTQANSSGSDRTTTLTSYSVPRHQFTQACMSSSHNLRLETPEGRARTLSEATTIIHPAAR